MSTMASAAAMVHMAGLYDPTNYHLKHEHNRQTQLQQNAGKNSRKQSAGVAGAGAEHYLD